jgi:hypothetical protein
MKPIKAQRVFLNDVLFVLSAGNSLGWPTLNRTGFQKILYLGAALSPLIGMDWGYEFTNAPYGPFNSQIHIASDLLVYRKLAAYSSVTIQRDSKIRATYSITQRGITEVEVICGLGEEKDRLKWITTLMEVLDIYGSPVITKLAYQEPTFSLMRSQNRGGPIDLSATENRSIELIERISHGLKEEFAINLDTMTSNLIAYFDYLSRSIGPAFTQ